MSDDIPFDLPSRFRASRIDIDASGRVVEIETENTAAYRYAMERTHFARYVTALYCGIFFLFGLAAYVLSLIV